MKINYKKYTLPQLESLVVEISMQIEELKKREAENIRQKIDSLLEASGLNIEDVYIHKDVALISQKVPMKYRHPTDSTIQWSGRGKMPVWMRELVEQGAKKEDFLIK